MNIIKSVIYRKTFISMLFIGLSLLGIISYRQLPLELMPGVEYPYLLVQVSVTQETDPQYVEKQAVIPIEGIIGTMEGVSSLETNITQRRGTIYVYFKQDVKIEYAYLKLQEKINQILPTLSDDFHVSIVKVDTERLTNQFMRLQVRGSGGVERVRSVIDNDITDALENIDGIANVDVTGGEVKSVEIKIDDQVAKKYHLSLSRFRNLLRQNNRDKSFVGYAYENNKRYFVNLNAEYTEIATIENIIVSTDGPIRLKDIAQITYGVKEQETISRINGKDAVTIQLVRDANANLIDLARITRETIASLNEKLSSKDIEIVIQGDSAQEIEDNINLIVQLGIIGGILAVLILWFFIRNLRLVVTVLLAIPVSVFIAFNLFYAFGISLNSLTLVGMVLAIGMLLDNSVVVLENIYRHISLKRDFDTAVIVGTQEVWRSITAATLTTVTVFLPFVFSTDYTIKMIGRHVGISIISTLLVSMFAALMLIPMITHKALKRKQGKLVTFNKVSRKNRLLQIYTVLLKTSIRYPAGTIAAIAVIFVVTVVLCLSLSMDVPREVELKQFNIYVTMPTGSTLENTSDIVTQVEDRIKDIPEIKDRISTIYEEEATVTVVLKDDFEKTGGKNIYEIKSVIQGRIDNFRSADVSLSEPTSSERFGSGQSGRGTQSMERMFGIGQQQEKIVLKGNDNEILVNIAQNIQYYLEELETISSVRVNVPSSQPEVHMLLNPESLNRYNVSISDISSELSSFQNEVSSGVTFRDGLTEYDIMILNGDQKKERNFADLKNLRIADQSDGYIEMDELGQLVFANGVMRINRINQRKQIEVSYSFESGINESKEMLAAAREEVESLLAAINIPSDVVVEVEKDESQIDEFYFLIGAAFILIYMILASVFESLATPVVMMFTIPLATIGSFWALIITGNSVYNANALIGFLILLGVVVNNGIILIDYTKILRKRGYRRSRALMTAGMARVRPILITAITTIVAMIPLAMGQAEYVSQIGASFAITVIGGLSLSMLFTLVFIPMAYSAMETFLAWAKELPWQTKIIQAAAFVVCCAIIYFEVDNPFAQTGYMLLALTVIFTLTWFFMASLRQAREDVILPGKSISISIRRVVKIYDDYTRFMREWKKGERIDRYDVSGGPKNAREAFSGYVWQVPALGFMIYFTYYYLKSETWAFFLSFGIYLFAMMMWKTAEAYLMKRSGGGTQAKYVNIAGKALLWGIPIVNLAAYYKMQFRTEMVLFIGMAWFAGLTVYTVSGRLRTEKVNIMRLTGRFAGLRRRIYQIITVIPFIGSQKNPFGALNGISLEIENGMFGLLGPNGAGKTTIMRIICGILEQSRGTIKISDINFTEKREELLGLIGYLPQEFGYYENMTAYEFLDYIAILKGLYNSEARKKRVNYVLGAVHLNDVPNKKISSFSGGMKQRMGIAMTLLSLPRILVVDEPTAGLDPRERIRFRNLMVELSRERIVIFSTHIIEDISSSCDQVAVLNRGDMVYRGDPRNMAKEAAGKVWQMSVTPDQFNVLRNTLRIVHHIRVEDMIRVRCLSVEKPREDAVAVTPSLEDAYLWLLNKSGESLSRVKNGVLNGNGGPQ